MSDLLDLAAFDMRAWFLSLGVISCFVLVGWLLSLIRDDVSIVDSLWSLMFLLALAAYLFTFDNPGWRADLMVFLVLVWSVRLAAYITWRNHGQPEDHRYQEIRANHEPGFRFKSLYIVFGLQGFLAWVLCLPMLAAISGQTPPGLLDYIGIALWLIGMLFETIGDQQLTRFRANPDNHGKVLDTGLWRYTRHPNYFGECLLWWGYFLIAASAGGAWTVFAPLLMTFLLLKVSGVALLEKDIGNRRPAYRDYIQNTPAFIPGRPHKAAMAKLGGRHSGG